MQMKSCDLTSFIFPIVGLCHLHMFKSIKAYHNFHNLPILTPSGTQGVKRVAACFIGDVNKAWLLKVCVY